MHRQGVSKPMFILRSSCQTDVYRLGVSKSMFILHSSCQANDRLTFTDLVCRSQCSVMPSFLICSICTCDKRQRPETNSSFHAFLPHMLELYMRQKTKKPCHAFLPHVFHLYMRQKTKDRRQICYVMPSSLIC